MIDPTFVRISLALALFLWCDCVFIKVNPPRVIKLKFPLGHLGNPLNLAIYTDILSFLFVSGQVKMLKTIIINRMEVWLGVTIQIPPLLIRNIINQNHISRNRNEKNFEILTPRLRNSEAINNPYAKQSFQRTKTLCVL